jgi:hypothetical protein
VEINPTMLDVVVGIEGTIFPDMNLTLSLEQKSILKFPALKFEDMYRKST